MTSASITIIIMLFVFFLLVGWDIYVAFFNEEPGDTESNILRKFGRQVGGAPFAWGVLGGHFWGPDGITPFFGPTASPVFLLMLALVLSIFHVLAKHILIEKYTNALVLIYLIAGLPLGAIFWPQ